MTETPPAPAAPPAAPPAPAAAAPPAAPVVDEASLAKMVETKLRELFTLQPPAAPTGPGAPPPPAAPPAAAAPPAGAPPATDLRTMVSSIMGDLDRDSLIASLVDEVKALKLGQNPPPRKPGWGRWIVGL